MVNFILIILLAYKFFKLRAIFICLFLPRVFYGRQLLQNLSTKYNTITTQFLPNFLVLFDTCEQTMANNCDIYSKMLSPVPTRSAGGHICNLESC